MASFPGGTAVKRGYYIDGRQFEFATVERDGDALPGGPERRWLHLPVLAVVAAAPALGGLLVISLPFLTVGVAAYTLVKKLAGALAAGAREVGATLAPELRPGEAHLTGKPEAGAPPAAEAKPESKPAARAAHSEIDDVAKAVEQARQRRE